MTLPPELCSVQCAGKHIHHFMATQAEMQSNSAVQKFVLDWLHIFAADLFSL